MHSRRTVLAAAIGGVTTALAGCTGSTESSDTTDEATSTQTQTKAETETQTTTSTQQSLEAQLETVREASAKYTDIEAALEDGYQFGGPYVPGMGWHVQNPEYLQQAAENGFDLEKPPILTYLETDDGLTLGSVEFGAPAAAIPENPDLFVDEGTDATEEWHSHDAATHVFATPDDQQTNPKDLTLSELATKDYWTEFHPPDSDLSAGETVALNWGTASGKEGERTERVADIVATHPGLRTLHVWVHAENPEGVFAPMNPQFAESDGGHHGDSSETEHSH
ncbi:MULTISPECIES: hypothetical protein [Haloferax]|uniref:Uncharacterized protein n=2 Tax=Haloferax TaxID=2251 RepID=A0A6G1YZC2_9EURY|nr:MULTISPECIES: hypothetical protein [Haloferax]KAB1186983.1 hypothetical protein Hfx1149_02625 [Haloferax sp. CBA1149]MRW79613.1 hypothetical protein [Haloferax marinisediminis]